MTIKPIPWGWAIKWDTSEEKQALEFLVSALGAAYTGASTHFSSGDIRPECSPQTTGANASDSNPQTACTQE